MSPLSDRRLARLLKQAPTAEPPPELLEALRRELPEQPSFPEASRRFPRPASAQTRRFLAAAAGLFMALGGGWLAWQVDREAWQVDIPGSAPPPGALGRETAMEEPVAGDTPVTQAEGMAGAPALVDELIDEAPELEALPASPQQGHGVMSPETSPERSKSERREREQALREVRQLGHAAGKQEDIDTQPAPPSRLLLDEIQVAAPAPQEKSGSVSASATVVPDAAAEAFAAPPPPSPARRATLRRAAPIPDLLHVPGAAPFEMPPSTGGTAEPNDQPWGDVFFRGHGVNPFVDTEDDPLSTFGLSVDTASYTVVRRYLREGHLPPAEAVRLEEMVSYFAYGDSRPESGDFAIHAQGMPSPWPPGERYWLLRLGLQAREVQRSERRPAVLTFVVDVSGSMAYGGRLEVVRRALELLIDQLEPGDRVGLVTYDNTARVLLAHSSDREALRRALATLRPGGSTNAEAGLVTGYRLAREAFTPGASHRVVFLSDGVANVGRTGAGSILERIGEASREGIELTAVGVGMGNYNDALLEELARRARGRYVYVDTLAEARRVFVEELTGTLETVAEEARAQVEFDPTQVARYRLLGYESRPVPHRRFRDSDVDSGQIGAGHAVTVLYEVKLHPRAERSSRPLALLRLRYRPAGEERFVELERPIPFSELATSWQEAPRELRLSAVVARFSEVLRGSYWAREANLEELVESSREVARAYPEDPRVAELAELVELSAGLIAEERRRRSAP
jgi:Ca-activated chloride channel homolog